MHLHFRILPTLLSALLFSCAATYAAPVESLRRAQGAPSYCFRHFTTANSGLSFNSINCLAEDSIGFIWAGTSDGLNRYDGNRFTTFMKEDLGLSSSFIVSLFPDTDRMWIGTDNGVACYDYHMNRFIPFTRASDKATTIRGKVTAITKDRQGNIWFAVNEHGAFCYDRKSERLTNYFNDKRHRLPANIRTMYFDREGRCLVSLYYKNLYLADIPTERLSPYPIDGDTCLFANDNILDIREASDSTLYVLSVNHGVVELYADGHSRILADRLRAHEPLGISLSPEGDIWIPTTDGLFRYIKDTGELAAIVNDPDHPTSLVDNYVNCFMQDSRGALWCGTYSSGLDYSSAFTDNFRRTILKTPGLPLPAKVQSIDIDPDGNIWLATARGGLMRTDAATGITSRYRPDVIPLHTYDVCTSNKEVWVSASSGIYRIDTQNGTCRLYHSANSKTPFKENKLIGIKALDSGDILILTTLGVYRYDRSTDSFETFRGLDECYVTDIAEDDYGRLWISTFAHGLLHYDPRTQTIVSVRNHDDDHASLPTDKLLSVMIDNQGHVWASTYGAGIISIDEKGCLKVYDRKFFGDILPSNVIYRLFQDKSGKIWATTSCGLLSFNPDKGGATMYHTHHGLLNEDFASTRGTVGRDGTFYLCSADGYISFKPQLLRQTTDKRRLVITSLTINGQRIDAGTGDILSRAIDDTGEIRLPHHRNDLELTLSNLSFTDIDGMNGLLYRLKGSEREWRPIPSGGVLSFPNLTPGDYELEFRTFPSDSVAGLGSKTLHAPLRIHISQVFYKTTLAWILYIVVSIILISILWQTVYHRRMRRAEEARRRELKEQEMEAYNEKMTMISYIANSLRTPLALIRNPLTNILRTGVEGQLADDFMVIRNGTERLSKVLGEFTAMNDSYEERMPPQSDEASTDSSVPVMVLPGGGNIIKLTDADADFIKKLDEIVLENIGDPDLSNTILARQLCMSKSTLVRKIKNLLNTTPKDYVLGRRLALAADMLKRPACRVNEVCYAVGFNTPSYFAKCFKKQYGMLPSEYRAESTPMP